ncbi:MAG: serine hydrolase [Clostridia bacterium]|nr:serine hydrolase [Clostridia bacterium]
MRGNALLPRSTPSAEGLRPEAVAAFIDDAAAYGIELHSLMIIKNGRVATEGWWHPYAPELLHGCYSVTKTFTGSAIGFAIDEGLLSLTDRLCDFFPDRLPENPSENLLAITVHDLLCMGCGDEVELDITDAPYDIRAFMATDFIHKPGTAFHYNSLCSHMLAQIIFKLTGQSLPEYLEPRLLEPLGISGIRWDKAPQGLEMGGWGIHIKTEDLAKMGLLYLQHGRWEGRQVLPAGWAKTASSQKIDNSPTGDTPEYVSGYCYQLWRGVVSNSYRLEGAYGQFSIILPDQNAVVAVTQATLKTEITHELIRRHLIPGMSDGSLPVSQAQEILAEKLRNLTLNESAVAACSPLEGAIGGKTYVFKENSFSLVPESERLMAFERNCGIRSAALSFDGDICTFTWREGDRETRVAVGLDGCYRETSTQLSFVRQPIRAVGRWADDSTFRFVMRAIEEPHASLISLMFQEDEVVLSFVEAMASHDPQNIRMLIGHRA